MISRRFILRRAATLAGVAALTACGLGPADRAGVLAGPIGRASSREAVAPLVTAPAPTPVSAAAVAPAASPAAPAASPSAGPSATAVASIKGAADPGNTPASTPKLDLPGSFDASNVFIYAPADAAQRVDRLKIVVAMHGMGGEGRGFCQGFLQAAERNDWIVLAPTFRYRNWRDPKVVAEDDVALTGQLVSLVDSVARRYGLPAESKVIMLGFSRGAQLAHRFALAYPDRTLAVVAMSAGTYTLPMAWSGEGESEVALSFPFGTADLAARTGHPIPAGALARVPFWVAVGRNDDRPEDVPRQWDPLLGRTRIERAQTFAKALKSRAASVDVVVYSGIGHAMSPEMISGATTFIKRIQSASGPTSPVVNSVT